jgi:hypothetical protein
MTRYSVSKPSKFEIGYSKPVLSKVEGLDIPKKPFYLLLLAPGRKKLRTNVGVIGLKRYTHISSLSRSFLSHSPGSAFAVPSHEQNSQM